MTTREPRTTNSPTSQDSLHLAGLDGTNPLGFLAALGVLRMLASAPEFASAQMSWAPARGTWTPTVCDPKGRLLDEDLLLDTLSSSLVDDITEHPASLLQILAQSKDDQAERRQCFLNHMAGATHSDRQWADWLSALASDVAPASATNQLQTTRRDYYVGNLTSIIARTESHHLRRSIFQPWDYADSLDNQSLHLDPGEDRRHAHQWNTPAGDPNRKRFGGMLGANRLAIEAIPLFSSFPLDKTLRTVGFTGNRSTNTRWTWPLWGSNITLPVVRSLLLLPELQEEVMRPTAVASLRERGVTSVFRTWRILVGKTPNFTPAQCIA